MVKPFIGIKRLWYGAPITGNAPTQSSIVTIIANMTEVLNSHDGTFNYSQDDPNVTDYINELSGKPYYRDMEDEGNKTINFTIGQYDFVTKAELQGGTALTADGTETTEAGTAVGWKAPINPSIIYKSIVAMTKTGNFVVFTNASIVGKTEKQERNLGLGIAAVAMDNPTTGISDEYWFDGSGISVPATPAV